MKRDEDKKPVSSTSTGVAFCSIVIPVYNEAGNVEELHRRTAQVMHEAEQAHEIIFVDDGSTDGTLEELKAIAETDEHVCVLELRRNFGQTPALAAGFDHARGDVIIAMDGDLQHAPEEIPRFLEHIGQGYDIVSGWRHKRPESLLVRRLPSWVANWMMRKISGIDLMDFGSTYKAYRRDMLDHVQLYGEMHRFIPALAAVAGARIKEIPVENMHRRHGESKYGLGRTLRVLMDLVTIKFMLSYMTRPLHLFGLIGLLLMGTGGAIDVFLLVKKLFFGTHLMETHGPLVILGVLLVLMGMLCFMTGLLGELLVRTYHESTGRRIYAVRNVIRGKQEKS